MKTICERGHAKLAIHSWQELGGEVSKWGSIAVCEVCGEISVIAHQNGETIEVYFKAAAPEVLAAIARGVYEDEA